MVKELYVLAGGNGSGKSTYFDRFIKDQGVFFVNADKIAKQKYSGGTSEDSKKAQVEAARLCASLLLAGTPFCFETVFSHESKVELIKKAKSLGYNITLIYIHLDGPALNVARVKQRVDSGGHPVPEDRIRKRIPRTIGHIKTALVYIDHGLFYDNTDDMNPFVEVCELLNGKLDFLGKTPPQWLLDMVQSY